MDHDTMTIVADAAPHPAECIDVQVAADTVSAWLLGEGPHWDPHIRDEKPEMASPEATLEYTMEGIVDHAFHSRGIEYEDLDPRSSLGRKEIAAWCLERATTAKRTLCALTVAQGTIRAHRLIGATASTLRADLGIFWTHSLDETVDIYPMWAPGGREAEALCIEALVPLASIDWQVSCMALMDWFLGDSEQELRLHPGHSVTVVSCERWPSSEEWSPQHNVILPDLDWRT